MRINENLREKYNSEYQRGLLEKWKTNIDAVKKVYPKYSDISAINLAIVCENTDAAIRKYKRMVNEGTQAADVGPYVRHAFEMLTAIMPNLVSEEVVSVQALNQRLGQIFFLKYVYGSNKGTATKGSTIFGPYEVNVNENYTSEFIDQEIIADGASTSISATLAYGPIVPGTVVITSASVEIKDDGAGKLYQGVTERGTINYDTGAVSITLAAATNEDVNAAYQYNMLYAPTQSPELNLEISERIVTARPRRLRTNYAFAAAYDVEKQFGINMDDELLEASVTEIKHEIDQEIMNDLYRQAGLVHSWDMTVPVAISKKQHYESFGIALNEGCNLIYKATKRARGNTVICGLNALSVCQAQDGYIPSNAEDKVGCYVAGTIKGQIKVIANPFYGDNTYVIAYKGNSFLDAGYVYAPYLPVFATSVIMLDDFVGRRGYATSYAKAMLNPNYYVRGTITHSPASVSANVTVVNDSDNPVITQVLSDNDHPVFTKESV